MLAGTSDITRNTPKVRKRVTCDTTVEITETPAYLNSFRLEGWAAIWRTRATRGSSDDQMCDSGGCPPWSVDMGPTRSRAEPRGRQRHGAHPSRVAPGPSGSRLGHGRGDAVGAGHLAEPVRARLRAALEGARRHAHQAELGPVAQVPL